MTILSPPLEARTREGKRVIIHEYSPKNSAGRLVTFPLKGTIILSEKPRRTKYQIWTLDGRTCLLEPDHKDNLVDFPPYSPE